MARHRHLSRRQRIVRRNRIILACTSTILLIAIIVIISIAVRGCNSKSTNNKETGNSVANTETNESTDNVTNTDRENFSSTEASSEETTAAYKVTSKGFKIEEIDGVTYVDGVLIANKTYSLPGTFVPTDPDQPVTEERSIKCLDKTLMSAWNTMHKDASAKGLNLYISSGYRSYNYQVTVYNTYVRTDGVAKADTYSSRPGHSEHQTGLCFDLNTIEDSFQYTDEGKWVNDNCYKYGFCIRFPKGKDQYTGYQYESWHLRYVGVDLATKLYNNGDWLSLEEFFGITSEYPN